MLTIISLSLLGCSSAITDEHSAPQTFGHLEGVQLFTCIQFERQHWGAQTDRCKVELIFHQPNQGPFPPSQELDPEEGECLYFEAGEEPQPIEMTFDGIDAGGMLTLINDEHSIELIRQTSSSDGIVYDMLDCTEDSFPFGEIFDLVVEGSELPDGIPEFKLEDAILFGKDLQYTNSSNELSAHSPSEDWPLTWQWLGAENGEDFIFEQHQKVLVYNVLSGQQLEGLFCDPSETELQILAEDFDQFNHLEENGVSGQVEFYERLMGPSQTLPWGEPFNSFMNYRQVGESIWQ